MEGAAPAGLHQDELGFHTIASQTNTCLDQPASTISKHMKTRFTQRHQQVYSKFGAFTSALAAFYKVYFKVCAVFSCEPKTIDHGHVTVEADGKAVYCVKIKLY